jgi:anti-sigma B factor antagonist
LSHDLQALVNHRAARHDLHTPSVRGPVVDQHTCAQQADVISGIQADVASGIGEGSAQMHRTQWCLIAGGPLFKVTAVPQVERSGRRSRAVTLLLAGELDVATAPELERTLQAVLANGQNEILVDMEATGFIDCSGMKVLIRAAQSARRGGGFLVLQKPSRVVQRMLQILSLDELTSKPEPLGDHLAPGSSNGAAHGAARTTAVTASYPKRVDDERLTAEAELARQATLAMQAWLPFVQGIPLWARTPRHIDALDGLVAWYERVCTDVRCSSPSPVEGLDAFVDEFTDGSAYETFMRFGLARWAIRVSEELVRWRASLSDNVAPSKGRVLSSRLELALKTAIRQFGTTPLLNGRATFRGSVP